MLQRENCKHVRSLLFFYSKSDDRIFNKCYNYKYRIITDLKDMLDF